MVESSTANQVPGAQLRWRRFSLALWTTAGLLLLLACVPRGWVAQIGPLIGRPNAVSAEVHWRADIVLVVISAMLAGVGWIAAYRPNLLDKFWQEWRQERLPFFKAFRDDVWPLTAIVAVGIVVRAARLNTPMAYDEAYTFLNYARKSLIECMADFESTNNHLLNSIVMHALYLMGGPREAVLRLGVFTVGILLIPATYAWARLAADRAAALLAAALVAVAPALIAYSVDARGYGYVTLAAICLDLACREVAGRIESPRHWMAIGIVSAVMGLWAMPIMLYAVLGSNLALVCLSPSWRRLLAPAMAGGALVAGIVFLLYSPAFVFRGLTFLQDPIMRPTKIGTFPQLTWQSWLAAWEWWTAGTIPSWAWGLSVAVGLVAFAVRAPRQFIAWCCPFAAVLVINLMKMSAPPARILVFLSPWIALAAARGVVAASNVLRFPVAVVRVATAAVLLTGAMSALNSPVLIHEAERFQFLDVPAMVAAVQQDAASTRGADGIRLLAPLPTDYPARFYIETRGIDLALNGLPRRGEFVYAIVRNDRGIAETLAAAPVSLSLEAMGAVDWIPVSGTPADAHPWRLKLLRTRNRVD